MRDEDTSRPGVFTLTLLAGIMMILIGIFQAEEGITALLDGSFYVLTPNYAFRFDVTAWGWIHLLLGIFVATAGACLFFGQVWARIVALAMAVLSAIANFSFIPYYPSWAIIVIVFDIGVIWALAFHGGDVSDLGDIPGGRSR